MAGPGSARRGGAWLGWAGLGVARHGKDFVARQGEAGLGMAGHGKARQGEAGDTIQPVGQGVWFTTKGADDEGV